MSEFDTKNYVRRERPSIKERDAVRKRQAEEAALAVREHLAAEHARRANMDRLRALKKS